MRAWRHVLLLVVFLNGCATYMVNSVERERLERERRRGLLLMAEGDGENWLKFQVRRDFLGLGVDVSRLDAVGEARWKHVLAGLFDRLLTGYVLERGRKLGYFSGDRGCVVHVEGDGNTVIVGGD